MADYQAQIRLAVQGLPQLDQLQRRLESATRLLNAFERRASNVEQAAGAASRQVGRAGSGVVRARQDLATARRERVRGEGGRFAGADLPARRRAEANLRIAEIGLQQEARSLREINEERRRYAARLRRVNEIIGNTAPAAGEVAANIENLTRIIGRGSRGNKLTNLFQGRQQEFARGGAGAGLSQELQQQARNVRAAWDIATAGGRENLQLMARLADEMSGLVRQQNELNRGGSGRSIAFEAGRRGQERITELSRMVGADPSRIRGLRSRATNVIATGNTGDIAGAREAQRRMNVAIGRYERELNRAARELGEARRRGGPSLPIRGATTIEGSPAYLARQARLGGPRESIKGRKDVVGSPAYYEEQQKQLARAVRAGGPRESIKGRKDLPGSPAYVERELRAQRTERNRIDRLRQIASPIRGTATMEGSPAYVDAQSRVLGRSLNVRTSWQRALGEMGAIAQQNRRALPSSALLAERIARTPGGSAPRRLDELKAQEEKRLAKEAERAAGSVGRFAAALEREEKRRASLGIGAVERVGASTGRARGGAIPMGGQGGRPGMFNQYPFPAGPGNVYGAAEFRSIQRATGRPGAGRGQAQPGFFQGNRRDTIGNAIIGGAFPLLFGQGVGASAGGLAGGALGGAIGGSFGFGLSLVGTAIGQAVDTTSNNLKELATSLKAPNDAIQALEKNGFNVSDSIKFQVQQLQSVGRAYDAQTLVLREVEKRLGPGAAKELGALNTEQKKLQESWSILAGDLQRLVIPGIIGFTVVLNDVVSLINSVRGAGGNGKPNSAPILDAVGGLFSLTPSGRKAKAAIASSSGRPAPSAEDAFRDAGARIDESRKAAGDIKSAYREAFNLQRQAHDLQRDGADLNREIADYSYKKEREIFDLRQQALEKQIENARGAAQNRIERGDLGARGAFASAVGFEQQLLSNVREVMRTRREGEADIEQSRRRLELTLVKLGRDAEDYKRTNAREIEDIERRKLAYVRSVEDYRKQVADYVYDRSIKAADYMRQAMTLPGMGAGGGAPAGAGAPGGGGVGPAVTPRTLMGVPGVIEYLTGDRSSPGYRADHGGSNYHEHIAFASRQIRDNVIAMLRKSGIVIGSTDGGRHAPNSYHYSGQAVDIPGAQVPVGQEDALARRVRSLIAGYLGGAAPAAIPAGPQASAAAQISNVPAPVFRNVPIGPTPSAAPVNAARLAAGASLKGGEKEAQRILEDQIKLRQKGVELGQIEQILQDNQLPQLQQQADALQRQIEARKQAIGLSDQATAVADGQAEAAARLTQIEKDRVNALTRAKTQYNPQELVAATKQINEQAGLAVDIAKKEEEQRRKNIELNNQLQNQDRVRSEVLQLQEALAVEKVQAIALERGELKASNVELSLASTLYQQAGEAQRQKLSGLVAETEELRKQNEFRRQINELQRDTGLVGAGIRAGFVGGGARAFEQGLRDFDGDAAKATDLANRTNLLESQKLVWENLEKNIVDVSSAISGSLTNGLVDIVSGTKKIEDVGREMLKNIAGSFADAAQQQLTSLLQRQLAGVLSGVVGGGGGGGGGFASSLLGAAAPSLIPGFSPSFAFGGFFANGGTTKPGEGYVIGEKGPEFFFPGMVGSVVPRDKIDKAAGLRGMKRSSNSVIDLRYTVTEQRGERYVTEEQFRKSNAALVQRARNSTYAGIRNSKDVRDYAGIPSV